MKKSEFLLEVKAELDNLKAKATKKEISKLNFENFDHNSSSNCIYGQMTEHCESARAKKLSPKVYSDIGCGHIFSKQNFKKEEKYNSYTALEKYLFMVKKPTHKKIISYLKGEFDTIKLT